jgi:transcriptional regulator with XRE-family HTH domain
MARPEASSRIPPQERHRHDRSRDRLINKKIGSVIRMQCVKLRMSQSDLGNFLGVTFQQIQKYENGGHAVASTRIPALCQTLEISPNDLFGVSARMDGELSQLDSWAMETAAQNTGAVAGDAANGRWTA